MSSDVFLHKVQIFGILVEFQQTRLKGDLHLLT